MILPKNVQNDHLSGDVFFFLKFSILFIPRLTKARGSFFMCWLASPKSDSQEICNFKMASGTNTYIVLRFSAFLSIPLHFLGCFPSGIQNCLSLRSEQPGDSLQVLSKGEAREVPFCANVALLVPFTNLLRRHLVLVASHASVQWFLLEQLARMFANLGFQQDHLFFLGGEGWN